MEEISEKQGEFSDLYIHSQDDVKQASIVFQNAFIDNPMFKYLLPERKSRQDKLRFVFEYMIKYGLRYGVVYSPTENMKAIAIWISGDYVNETFWRQIRAGGLKTIWKLGIKFLKKQISLFEYTERTYKSALEQIVGKHIYLYSICVSPESQGKGLATQLLTPMLNFSQRNAIPIYLETAKNDNIPLYEHFGFQIYAKDKIKGTPYTNYGMLRIPKK